ncbi:hypothetical protein, partial [Vibrio alfacsensis]|uniref:hypothetical protein n=1 Tax=Vibrio alfacsensis TaxID=1074311 RepID=UPI004068EBDD
SKVVKFGVYWFLCSALQRFKCAFHVLSGGTRCAVCALPMSLTVSNFRVISLARLLCLGWFRDEKPFLWCGRESSKSVSFANLKVLKIIEFCVFFF